MTQSPPIFCKIFIQITKIVGDQYLEIFYKDQEPEACAVILIEGKLDFIKP